MSRRRGRTELALARAVREATTIERQDAAAIELARRCAQAIDEGELPRAGRLLLETLVQLRLTPKARTAVIAEATVAARSALDELRERRERRA